MSERLMDGLLNIYWELGADSRRRERPGRVAVCSFNPPFEADAHHSRVFVSV